MKTSFAFSFMISACLAVPVLATAQQKVAPLGSLGGWSLEKATSHYEELDPQESEEVRMRLAANQYRVQLKANQDFDPTTHKIFVGFLVPSGAPAIVHRTKQNRLEVLSNDPIKSRLLPNTYMHDDYEGLALIGTCVNPSPYWDNKSDPRYESHTACRASLRFFRKIGR